MKTHLSIIIIIWCQSIFGQFAIIEDKDGYVNVRNSPNISNNIIDTLRNGQIVFCLEGEGEWYPIDYHLNKQNFKTGYLHNSRVKFIEDLFPMPITTRTDTLILFKKDSLELQVSTKKFNPKNNQLTYRVEDASSNEESWLEKINGKPIWGTDGNVPKYQYSQIILNIGAQKITLPHDHLYEPNLEYTSVHIDKNNSIIYLIAMNSDGAGAYAVIWIIENGKFKQQLITIPF